MIHEHEEQQLYRNAPERLRLPFLGTPYQFALALTHFTRRLPDRSLPSYIPWPHGELHIDSDPVIAYVQLPPSPARCWITVERRDSARSELIVKATDEDWAATAGQWERVRAELIKQGYIEAEQTAQAPNSLMADEQQPKTKTDLLVEQIADYRWDREAVRLWLEGNSVSQIAGKIDKNEKTIRNRLSKLRRDHGHEIVPLEENRLSP